MREYLEESLRLRPDAHGAGSETRYYECFRGFLLRSFPANYAIEGEGSYNQRRPDFRIFRLRDEQTRQDPVDPDQLLCLIEAKSHSENLIQLIRNDPRGQLRSYLTDISPNLLLTNYWEFRLLQINEENEIVTVEDGYYSLTETEEQFWNLLDQGEANYLNALENFQVWINDRVIAFDHGLDVSRQGLIRAMMSCYRMVNDSVLVDPPEGIVEERDDILRRSRAVLGVQQDDEISSLCMYIGQTIPMCMLMARRHYNHNILGSGGQFISSRNSRRIYSTILEYIDDFNLRFPLSRLEFILCNSNLDFDDVNVIEGIFEEFMRHGEEEFHSAELGLRLTPVRLVQYMVHLSHHRLSSQGGYFENGLLSDDLRPGYAHRRAVIYDPCTGTGRFYIETLRFIYANNLNEHGEEFARERLLSAIGRPRRSNRQARIPGRVIATDIQPACVLFTKFRLELFLSSLGINEETEPRIFITDSLLYWPGLTDEEVINHLAMTGMEGMYSSNHLKNNPVHVIIGNPPWSGASVANQGFQNHPNLAFLQDDWWNRYTELKRERNQKTSNRIDDPYLAFIRIAMNKSLNNNYPQNRHGDQPLVSCLVVPDSAYYAENYVAMREQLINNFEVDFDLLGGQQRRSGEWQRGKIFPVNTGSCVITFSRNENPETRYRIIQPRTSEDKLALLANDCNNINAINRTISRAHLDTWLDVTSGPLTDFPYPPINQITYQLDRRIVSTPGLVESRNLAYIHLDRETLRIRCEGLLNDNFETARTNGRRWNLWEQSPKHDDGRGMWSRYYPLNVHQAVLDSGGFNEDRLIQTTYRPMTRVWAYADPSIYKLWDEVRGFAFQWGQTSGMISIPGDVMRESNMTGFFIPDLPGNKNSGFQNCQSFPILFSLTRAQLSGIGVETVRQICRQFGVASDRNLEESLNLLCGPEGEGSVLECYPNLNVDFINWLVGDGTGELLIQDLRNLSRRVWLHVLTMVSSYEMSQLPILSLGNASRVPFPQGGLEGDLLISSAEMGLFISQLQSMSSVTNVQYRTLRNAVQNWFTQLQPEKITEGGDIFPFRLRNWKTRSTKNVTPYQRISEEFEPIEVIPQISALAESWELTEDFFCELMGNDVTTLILGEERILRNIPRSVIEFTISGHKVLDNWLAWRDYTSMGRDFQQEDWLEMRNLLINISCLILLQPRIDVMTQQIFENALEWNLGDHEDE